MAFKSSEKNEPFGAMIAWPDGRRSPIPADFLGPPLEVLSAAAETAKHPVLRARLSDLCWILDLKRAKLARAAIAAYVDIVNKVDTGALSFRHDEGKGALRYPARDLLRRALVIGKATGWNKDEAVAARKTLSELGARAIDEKQLNSVLWFNELDLGFEVSDPAVVGKIIEDLILTLPAEAEPHTVVELWRLAARAYKNRCRSAAAEQLVLMAERQPMAMMASSILSDAISELRGLPGKKGRRRELRHGLVDVQAGISEEMSGFSVPMNLEDIIKAVEAEMRLPTLRDQLFMFAGLDRSPDPAQLATSAANSIRWPIFPPSRGAMRSVRAWSGG